ncbi:hypothetical protein GXB85_10900 [Cellulomonas sp. APG4]|uniref:hypothetical protein n=1 Tax=Cellulomonas sp. APG4 TaxID=1538656 RepID=UPI00137A742D|nr:hypothetical protein [Cellulomonas sp. APG4]NCT91456.1 hypothetical protein [Cellulomonas sp. APG4]
MEMLFGPVVLLLYLVIPAVILLALYWVIRLAVRHALTDVRGAAGPYAPPDHGPGPQG